MPRGMAIRFDLGSDRHKHTDIVSHSVKAFPMRTGEGFLAMLGAIGNGTIGKFLEENPSAAAFVQAPKPSPASFDTQKYFGLNAFKLVKDGKGTFVRYLIVPVAEYAVLSEEALASKSKAYLFDELADHLSTGAMEFKLLAQVELGTVKLVKLEPEPQESKDQKRIIFDPIPRVEGIEPSDDPLLDMRAAVYLISGKERRAAPEITAAAVA